MARRFFCSWKVLRMTLRSDILAFVFGAMVILVTFCDDFLRVEGGRITVGNLDTIFGFGA